MEKGRKGFGIVICNKCKKVLTKEPLVFKIKKAFKLTGFSRRREVMFKTLCSDCYNELFKM